MMYNKISLQRYLEMIGAPTATPGGGSVSAYAAAMASALGSMTSQIALKKVLPKSSSCRLIKHAQNIFSNNYKLLLKLAENDSLAYDKVAKSYKLPHHILKRRQTINKALKEAAKPPYEVMRSSLENLTQINKIRRLLPLQLLSDINVAILLTKSAYQGARLNVIVNVEALTDKEISRKIEKNIEKLEDEFAKITIWLDDWM
ncbi:MAG: cyclodeaminase/cyclohydrolase family protein [Planctomycetota bacterium]|nr:cyclodeaminase/cyclohydrolase family protein [Planctomycetota bacterium]MDI6786982.1 cyclodeaminase/cyclohydrolase family protein [Planctomycetota bacterium]